MNLFLPKIPGFSSGNHHVSSALRACCVHYVDAIVHQPLVSGIAVPTACVIMFITATLCQ